MDRHEARQFEWPVLMAIGILAFLLLGALEELQAEFEDAAMQSEAAALRVELLDRLAHHQSVGGPLPTSPNPLDWVERRPEKYLGALDAPPAAGEVKGSLGGVGLQRVGAAGIKGEIEPSGIGRIMGIIQETR